MTGEPLYRYFQDSRNKMRSLAVLGVQESTIDILLCVKTFRRHPQLAPSVVKVLGDDTNQTMSQAALKRKAQIANFQKLQGNMNAGKNKIIKLEGTVVNDAVAATAAASAAAAKQVEEANKNLNHAMCANVHMAKAMEESANVARKLGEIEAHEKNLSFLDQLRPVIGEEMYLARVRRLLASIPEPKTFVNSYRQIPQQET